MAEAQISNLKLDFVGSLLRKYENDNSIKITELNATPACEKGDNFMSVVSKVFVKGQKIVDDKEIDFTTSLIVKHPFQSELLQDVFQSNHIFHNEVIAYNEVIPALRKHYKMKLSIADCLYAGKDCIILNDLTLNNYQMKSDKCFNISDCVAVLKELAILHASSVVLKHFNPDEIPTLTSQIKEFILEDKNFFMPVANNTLQMTMTLLKKAESSETITRAIDFLEQNTNDIYPKIMTLFQKKYETAVFNHGDCWRNNLLFRTHDGKTEVRLVDLQIMRYSSIAADLSYLLFINLQSKIRRDNLDYFLEQYFETFRGCILKHGINFDDLPFTKEKLRAEMYDFQIFGFLMSLIIAPIFYVDKSLMPDMEDIKPDELDAELQTQKFLDHLNPDLERRMIDIIVDIVDNYKF